MQFGVIEMIQAMGPAAIATNIILLIMSMYSIGLMIERAWAFHQARDPVPCLRASGRQVAEGRQDHRRHQAQR